MKRLFTFFAVVFLVSTIAKADGPATYVLDDFENGLVNFTEVVNVNPAAHFDIAVVDNPVKAGINTSNKVWEWKRFDAEAENKVWAGFYATLKNEIPKGYHRIEIKYLRTNATSQIKIKPEGAVSKEIAALTPASKTNEWETMVFDIYANGILNIRTFGFFPDFYEPVDPTAKVYVDDIKIVFDASIVPPVVPTLLTIFDNSANDRFHDQSWSFKNAPSTLVQENWEGPNMANGDKLPCVTSPVKSATNALKLQWKSVTGGDWAALTAAVGWTSFDASTMTHLKLWVNSPVTLTKAAMPKLHLEAHSGNPNATGKVELGNYLTEDLAANTWTQIVVPLADIWATNSLFTSKNVIKGVFFSQNAADDIEHTMFIDVITLEKVTSLFTNSASDRFHDQSWSFKNAPSTLTQVHWDATSTEPGDKLPCVTAPVKSATNAIKLQWNSATGGDWAALVAGLSWAVYDLAEMTHVNLWVNSPANLAKTALPKVHFEAHSGNPNTTGKIELGNYTNDLVANKWTEISIPLADFWAAKAEFTAKDVVKGLFFSQNAADAVEHTLYIDEISFAKVVNTGFSNPTMQSNIAAYYANGEIRIANYTGNVRVMDLAGKEVATKIATNGKVNLTLNKGIYIVNTSIGNAKLMVY